MDIRVGEHDPVSMRLLKTGHERVWLPQPARPQACNVRDNQIPTRSLEFAKDSGSLVCGSVIDCNDLKPGIILVEQGFDCERQFFRFVSCGKNNGNEGRVL